MTILDVNTITIQGKPVAGLNCKLTEAWKLMLFGHGVWRVRNPR